MQSHVDREKCEPVIIISLEKEHGGDNRMVITSDARSSRPNLVSDIIFSIPYRRESNRADIDQKIRLTNRQTQSLQVK